MQPLLPCRPSPALLLCCQLNYPACHAHPPALPHYAVLVQDLRQLPSKAALQLRADVAQAASVANNQRSVIEKMVLRLAKQGV